MRLTLLSREYCHVCHDMLDELRRLQAQFPFDLRVIDVDSDAALEDRYGELVPVLLAGETEICRYRLDRAALEIYFKEHA